MIITRDGAAMLAVAAYIATRHWCAATQGPAFDRAYASLRMARR